MEILRILELLGDQLRSHDGAVALEQGSIRLARKEPLSDRPHHQRVYARDQERQDKRSDDPDPYLPSQCAHGGYLLWNRPDPVLLRIQPPTRLTLGCVASHDSLPLPMRGIAAPLGMIFV
jgi:hypothetical protein